MDLEIPTSREGIQSHFAGTNESLRNQLEEAQRRLREAEHTITGLKAAQHVITSYNADLKKESNHLREELAVLRSQNPQTGNTGNESNAGTTVTPSPEDVKNLQECLQEIKHESREISRQSKEVHRQSEEVSRQTVELRDCVLSKKEEFSRKRRCTESETDRNGEENPAMQFLKTCKRYNDQTTRASISFESAVKVFIEDLSHAHELKSPLPHEKIRRNLADFVYSRKSYFEWHCLREVCEKGTLSTEINNFSVCQFHGSDCEFLVLKRSGNPVILDFTSFVKAENSTK